MNRKIQIIVVAIIVAVVLILLGVIAVRVFVIDKNRFEDWIDQGPTLEATIDEDIPDVVAWGNYTDELKEVSAYMSSLGFVGNITEISTDEIQIASDLVMTHLDVIDHYYAAYNSEVSYEVIVVDGEIKVEQIEE